MSSERLSDPADLLSDEEMLDVLGGGDIASRYGAESLNGAAARLRERPQLLTDAELGRLPALEYDIDGVLPTGGHSYLIGLRGAGKTFLALDWACHIALGRPWYGRPVKQGPVLYVIAEGARSLHTRLDCWKSYHKVPATHETGIRWFPRRLALLESESVDQLIDEVLAAGPPPRQVIIDTFARCTQGVKENDSDGIGRALEAVDQLREELGAGVLLVAHPSREGADNPRGHSSQDAAADAIWVLKEQDGSRVLTCSKMKDGDESAEFPLALCPIGSSVLLLPVGQAPVQTSLTLNQRKVLATMRDVDVGRGVTPPVLIDASEVRRSTVYNILPKLKEQGFASERKNLWSVTAAGLVQLSNAPSNGRPMVQSAPVQPVQGDYLSPPTGQAEEQGDAYEPEGPS